MKLFTRSTATGLLAIGLSLGIGASASFAVSDPPAIPNAPSEGAAPAASKKHCIRLIERRVVDLAKWSARVQFRMNLTQAQKDELIGEMKATSDALIAVALPNVQNATTKAQLKAACKAIFTDYRVYLVVHPRTFITANAWGWLARIDELQAKADALEAQGKDTSIAEAYLAQARNLALPIHDQLDGITPQVWNADPVGTKAKFKSAKSALRTVQFDVKQAAKILRQLSQ